MLPIAADGTRRYPGGRPGWCPSSPVFREHPLQAARIARYVERGGTVLVTFLSGIADEDDRIRLGGYPGAFRDLLGVSAEEFFPLLPETTVALDNGGTATL